MDTSELDYDLPSELIAQHPPERRDASRLLVYDRSSGAVRHRGFAELPEELTGELAVVNDTRVVPARIRIEQPKGEVLPVGRTLAEVRGLLNQVIRRLERLEGDVLAERHARIDDLALLVDLVSSGWRGVSERLERVEDAVAPVAQHREAA